LWFLSGRDNPARLRGTARNIVLAQTGHHFGRDSCPVFIPWFTLNVSCPNTVILPNFTTSQLGSNTSQFFLLDSHSRFHPMDYTNLTLINTSVITTWPWFYSFLRCPPNACPRQDDDVGPERLYSRRTDDWESWYSHTALKHCVSLQNSSSVRGGCILSSPIASSY